MDERHCVQSMESSSCTTRLNNREQTRRDVLLLLCKIANFHTTVCGRRVRTPPPPATPEIL